MDDDDDGVCVGEVMNDWMVLIEGFVWCVLLLVMVY